MSDLEEFFREQIRPYEDRIARLEELDRKKDMDISLLKNAIEHMKKQIDDLKIQLEKSKGGITSKTGTSHTTTVKKAEPKTVKK